MLRKVGGTVLGAILACLIPVTALADGGWRDRDTTTQSGDGTVRVSYERRESGSGSTRPRSENRNTPNSNTNTNENWCKPIPGQPQDCAWAIPPKPTQTHNSPHTNPRTIAIQAATQIHLPPPTPHTGPDPTTNKWQLIPIGYPIWLWTNTQPPITNTTTNQGITVSLHAKPGPTTFTMGDGTTITCTKTTPRPPTIGHTPSPTCGHTYTKTPHPNPTYTITTTTTWTVHWTAANHTGQLTLTRTTTTHLPIGELQTTRNR